MLPPIYFKMFITRRTEFSKWIIIPSLLAILSVSYLSDRNRSLGQEVQSATLVISAANEHGIELDPLLARDRLSIETVTNLFLGLTDIDPVTQEIRPKLATEWTISDDGKMWTFHLRNDVMWVHTTGLGEIAAERPVVAGDFVYSLKRACDPRLLYRNDLLTDIIAGCEEISSMPRNEVTDEVVFGDTIQVSAPDDTTLIIHQTAPAGYFLSLTAMPAMRAVPMETIIVIDDEWMDVTEFLSSGPFALTTHASGGTINHFRRNILLPADLYSGSGNIEHINVSIFEPSDSVANYHRDTYFAGGLDIIDLELVGYDPIGWMTENGVEDELVQVPGVTTLFFRYNMATSPFNNVSTRRAFSAIIDRQQLIDDLGIHHFALPMIHFSPPSILHAPPIDEVGVGFDLAYARQQMDLGAYPNCELPSAWIVTYGRMSRMPSQWAELAVSLLGCGSSRIQGNDIPSGERNHPESLTELSLYPNATLDRVGELLQLDTFDIHYFLSESITCTDHIDFAADEGAFLRLTRECTDVEELIEDAADTTQTRNEQYINIEERLFGEEGEFPVVPILVLTDNYLVKPWLDGPFDTDIIYGMRHWDTYSVDMEAKLAARGE